MLVKRRMIAGVGDAYVANPKELTLLRYYANSIAHLLPVSAG